MIGIFSKIALKILRHELKKEAPEIKMYLITELNKLCDEFKEFMDKEVELVASNIIEVKGNNDE